MDRETFKFIDGNLGNAINNTNVATVAIRDYYKQGYIELTWNDSKQVTPTKKKLEIPISHIVEINVITEEMLENKSMIARGTIGFFALPYLVTGVVAGPLILAGAVIGALTGIGKKKKKHDILIISYLEENEPDDLKMILLNPDTNADFGKAYIQKKIIFAERLSAKDEITPKADFVVV